MTHNMALYQKNIQYMPERNQQSYERKEFGRRK